MVDFFSMRLQEKILQLSFLRITVKPYQFLRLTANFFAVLRLTVDPIETLSFGNEFTSIITFHSLMIEEANPMLSYLDISFKRDFKSRFFPNYFTTFLKLHLRPLKIIPCMFYVLTLTTMVFKSNHQCFLSPHIY